MRRTRLKAVSDKRREQLRQYGLERKRYLALLPVCEICKTYKSFDVHHRAGREGKKLLEQEFWLAVCRKCHRELHENPRRARELGYLIG